MVSLARGEVNSAVNPKLDLFTAVEAGPTLTDVSGLRFRIEDISTPAKRVTPVQVFPLGPPGTLFELDPANASPGPGPDPGVRLGTGHFFAPWTVGLVEAIGDHRIVWEFNANLLSPAETSTEEFFVTSGPTGVATATNYCTEADVRAEGFDDSVKYTSTRVALLIERASRAIDHICGQWFSPRVFTTATPFKLDGRRSRVLFMPVPVIELTKAGVESQGFTASPTITDLDLALLRVYNRHLSGQNLTDRNNPKIAFIETSRVVQVITTGLLPEPRMWPLGRLNVILEGTFGYTEADGTSTGRTPVLIRRACMLLVIREIELEEKPESFARRERYRTVMDKEGDNTVRLQNIWLKGGITGDKDIDQILMMFKRGPQIGATSAGFGTI